MCFTASSASPKAPLPPSTLLARAQEHTRAPWHSVSIRKEATAGIYIDGNSVVHGFVRSHDGGISSFDPSGSVYTYPCEETCVSQDGAITGFYLDANNTFHGFLRDPDGTIREFDAPGGERATTYLGTVAASINPDGKITGYVEDSNAVAHGFVRA